MLGYLFSVGAGILVGVLYGAMGVRSPAPPLIALAGLLGILAGEQAFAYFKRPAAPSGFVESVPPETNLRN